MKYLKSSSYSEYGNYKVCIVHKNKKKLIKILQKYSPNTKIGKERRSGWVGFVYFNKFIDAIKLREELYYNKSCFVFLQYDKQIINYYAKGDKNGRKSK